MLTVDFESLEEATDWILRYEDEITAADIRKNDDTWIVSVYRDLHQLS